MHHNIKYMKRRLLFLWVILSVLFISCGKDYSVEGITGAKGSWSFTEGTRYSGNIDTAYIEIGSGVKILHLDGTSSSGTEKFHIQVYTIDSFKVGTYKASLSEASFSYTSGSNVLYDANGLAGEFTVTISYLNGNHITGQFSGGTYDVSGNVKNISFGGFSSSIDLSNNAFGVSNGTLGSAAGLCTPVAFAGTYTQGVIMNSTNNIMIDVNVTATGSYSITTNTVNGVTFSGTGMFISTGVQSVQLNASGTPISAGSQVFTITYGTTNCTFSLTFN
jgi:hypothetical protein